MNNFSKKEKRDYILSRLNVINESTDREDFLGFYLKVGGREITCMYDFTQDQLELSDFSSNLFIRKRVSEIRPKNISLIYPPIDPSKNILNNCADRLTNYVLENYPLRETESGLAFSSQTSSFPEKNPLSPEDQKEIMSKVSNELSELLAWILKTITFKIPIIFSNEGVGSSVAESLPSKQMTWVRIPACAW